MKFNIKIRWKFLLILIALVYGTSAVSIMPEIKHNVLSFGYGVNFRYEGMLSHSFDRFYVVTKVEIPKVSDLNLTLFQFDYNCSHVVNIEKGMNFKVPSLIKDMFRYIVRTYFHTCICTNIKWNIMRKQYMIFWKKDIGLILPRFEDIEKNVNQKCQRRQIISALISGFIGLASEGISSILQHK